jgi:hypothetical protein
MENQSVVPMESNVTQLSNQPAQIPVEKREEPIRFNNEELKSIVSLREKYNRIITNFGQLYIERVKINDYIVQLNETEKKLQSEYTSCQKEEENLLAAITNKYGEGSLSLADGTFVPSKK